MLRTSLDVPNGIQALDAIGTVNGDDYERVFRPLVEEARTTSSRLRLIYEFGPDFRRITPGALWADSRLGLGYVRVLDGCAIVSDIEWIRRPSRRIGAWLPCPVRVFRVSERQDAVDWLTSLPPAPAVRGRDVVKAYVGGVLAGVGSLGTLSHLLIPAANRHAS